MEGWNNLRTRTNRGGISPTSKELSIGLPKTKKENSFVTYLFWSSRGGLALLHLMPLRNR